MALKPKVYYLEFSLTANGTVTKTFSISDKYDWTMTMMTHAKTGDAEIKELKVGDENMLESATRIDLICGNTSRLLPLPQPLYIPKKTTVTCVVTDKSAAVNTVSIAFIGVKKEG